MARMHLFPSTMFYSRKFVIESLDGMHMGNSSNGQRPKCGVIVRVTVTALRFICVTVDRHPGHIGLATSGQPHGGLYHSRPGQSQCLCSVVYSPLNSAELLQLGNETVHILDLAAALPRRWFCAAC